MKTVYLSVRLKNYENALALVGAPLAETPENADVLLLPGGGDMHPRFYGQALNGSEDLDEARDARELTLIDNFLCAGKPVIGICRGLQVLNVYFGGTLRQHIEGHSQIDGVDRLHAINTAPGRKASDCLKCGKCEKVCPQHLPIRKLLEQVAAEFEKAPAAN